MTVETIESGPGFRIATSRPRQSVCVHMDASLAVAIGDALFKAFPGSESIGSIRVQFAAALANAGFTVLTAESGWPADVRAFTQAQVMASAEEG